MRYLRLFEVSNRSEKYPLWDASTQANICRAFVWSGKSFGDVSGRGSVRRGCVWSGKCPSGMCLVGEVSVGDMSGRGNFCREVSVGEESVGEMSVGEVSGNLKIDPCGTPKIIFIHELKLWKIEPIFVFC